MLSWVRDMLWNEGKFIGVVRAALLGFGTAAAGGFLPVPEDWRWMGILAAAAGGFIRAGERNPRPEEGKE